MWSAKPAVTFMQSFYCETALMKSSIRIVILLKKLQSVSLRTGYLIIWNLVLITPSMKWPLFRNGLGKQSRKSMSVHDTMQTL